MTGLRAVGVIPARYASSRFPGKVLAPIAGRPMIQHVVERARRAARLDAQHWISLIRTGKAGGPSKGQVYGAEVLFEQELPDGSYLVKMKAPLF